MIDQVAFSTDVLAATTEIVVSAPPFDWSLAFQAIIAICTVITAFLAYLAKQNTSETKEIALKTHDVAVKTEIHTNSITAELNKTIKMAADAEGLARGIAQEQAKAAAEAKGRREGAMIVPAQAPLAAAPEEDIRKVEVVNEAKPVPVKITKTEAGKIVAAAKQPRRKVKRK